MKMEPCTTVFTIGHSTHTEADFLSLLRRHRITALADVRSVPYSRTNPQFNRERLKAALQSSEIQYVFLGKELGGRSDNPSDYERGRVQYEKLAKAPSFQEGLQRVVRGAQSHRIAIMCAEKDPLNCHRSILVARYLIKMGVDVAHIHANGTLESHDGALCRLADLLKDNSGDMFRTSAEQLDDMYRVQEERIAYVDESAGAEADAKAKQEAPNRIIKLFTIGFTQKTAEKFFTSLQRAGVKRMIDTRLNNVSQLAGFAKKDDLRYFLRAICGIEYEHMADLAPTQAMLDDYKKRKGDWQTYEEQFLQLIQSRRIEELISREKLDHACLLCSEDRPNHCHRRLVAEYLQRAVGGIEIQHIV